MDLITVKEEESDRDEEKATERAMEVDSEGKSRGMMGNGVEMKINCINRFTSVVLHHTLMSLRVMEKSNEHYSDSSSRDFYIGMQIANTNRQK